MHLAPRMLLLCSLGSAAVAQTYIVDQANGPGTNFTDLSVAASTVPDGAVLLVRPGAYGAFTIAAKGLSVLFDAGATSDGATIVGTSAQQSVLVHGMRSPGLASLTCSNCLGLVLVVDCGDVTWFFLPLMLNVSGCDRFHAAQCTFGGSGGIGATLNTSRCVFRACKIAGYTGMSTTSGSVQLVDCSVDAVNGYPTGPAIWMNAGDVRIVGGRCTTWLQTNIAGTGVLRVDPTVTFSSVSSSSPWIDPGIQFTTVPMPAVTANDASLGTNITATMRGPNGDVGALLVGLPGLPLLVPGFADAFWLQPGTEAVCAFTVFAAGVPLAVTYAVPNVPAMRGMRYCWQGASYGAANGLQASNPAITTHW